MSFISVILSIVNYHVLMHNQDDLGHALQKCLYSSFIRIDKTVGSLPIEEYIFFLTVFREW